MTPGSAANASALSFFFADAHDESRAARIACIAAAACGLFGVLLSGVLPDSAGLWTRLLMVLSGLALTGAAAWHGFGRSHPLLAPTIKLVGWILCVQIALVSWSLSGSLHAIALTFQSLVIVAVTTAGGARGRFGGISLAAACAAGTLLLSMHEYWVDDRRLGVVALTLLAHALLLGASVGIGLLVCRLLARQLAAVAERESRFRGLLRFAADSYWELDAELRFSAVDESLNASTAMPQAERVGRHPWELDLGVSEATMKAHRADLEARRPFKDFLTTVRTAGGRVRHVSVSGEPRFGADGVFIGFWGMGRDVTDDVEARRAVAAGESRYKELFEFSPTPLVLERDGVMIDANAAAVTLFGYPDFAAMRRNALVGHFDENDASLKRAREWWVRLDRLEPGQSLPPEDYTLKSFDDKTYLVSVTGVRVHAAGGPASMLIINDETARRSTLQAMLRSESLLAHLVATSPDVIALVEAGNGRFTMVNQTFSLAFGYDNAEVIGRTGAELEIWHHADEHARLMQGLSDHGSVESMPVTMRHRSGALLAMLVSASTFEFDGTSYTVFNARDVSTLESTRGVYEAILQNASVGIGFTRKHRIVQANGRLGEMFGWPDGSLIGQSADVLWSDSQDYARLVETYSARLQAGERVEFEQPLRRRDGSAVWCRIQGKSIETVHAELGGTIWIVEDITEKRDVAQALAQAYEAAESASKAKSAFLANTSHELRTPLNALLGLARLAQDEKTDAALRRRYVDQMADSAQTLADIINDILDLSKIEAGKLEIESVPFDLHDKLWALERTFATLADSRQLDLKLEIDPEIPRHVLGDPVRLRQILSNFVANALKFTARGSVRIRAFAVGERIRFEVVDTGPGIPADVLARLFTPFTQADESTTRRYGGTGLGLSICRQLATLMGGEVGVDSQVGRGSTFWCELHMPQDDHDTLVTQYSTFHGHDPLHGAHVLVVEDNPVNMMICVALLQQHGVRVSQADNGQAAIDAVRRADDEGRRFDVVLMDMQMPVMGGQEATRVLRKTYSADELPIVALTAAALVSEREEAMAAGMNAFLTKPIEPSRLVRALSRVLVGDAVTKSQI